MIWTAPETGLPDDDQANRNYSGISSRRRSLAHAPAEQLSEEAKPKQALFSHDGIDPPVRGKRDGNL
jgi:hypothetical protein